MGITPLQCVSLRENHCELHSVYYYPDIIEALDNLGLLLNQSQVCDVINCSISQYVTTGQLSHILIKLASWQFADQSFYTIDQGGCTTGINSTVIRG